MKNILKAVILSFIALAPLSANAALKAVSTNGSGGSGSGTVSSGTIGNPAFYTGTTTVGSVTNPAALASLSSGIFVDPRAYGATCAGAWYSIGNVTINSGGTGYVQGDTFIVGSNADFGSHVRGGLNATGHVISATGGVVTGIAIDNPGTGYYTGFPTQHASATSGSGTGLVLNIGSINSAPSTPTTTLANGGNNWGIYDVFSIPNSNSPGNNMTGVVNTLQIGAGLSTGGSGYTPGTYSLGFTGGSGSGAAGTYTVNGSGVVASVNITNGGSYFIAPGITFPSGGGTGASGFAYTDGVVASYTINNPGGDYVTANAVNAVAIAGQGHGLQINITSVSGNASNGTWDDTYGLVNAGAVAATKGGTVLVPDQCWIQTMMPVNGSTYMGMGWAPNYGQSDLIVSGQYLNPSAAPHVFMFGTPNFAIDLNDQGAVALIGFELRAYSLGAFGTSAGIGSYAGTSGYVGSGGVNLAGLVIPNIRTYQMSVKGFKVGYGTPDGTGNYLYVNDQNSDYSANQYGIYGPFSDYSFDNDIISNTTTAIWISASGGGLGRIKGLRAEYTSGYAIELDSGGIQTDIIGLQSDRSVLPAVFINGANQVKMTGGIIKGAGEAGTLTVIGAASDGGLIKLTVNGFGNNPNGCQQPCVTTTAGLVTGDKITVAGVVGTTEANGVWTITVIDGTHIDLQSSTFTNAYVSGGTGGVWNKSSDILIAGTGNFDFHADNVGFSNESGGTNIATAFIIDDKSSGANYDFVSFENGFAQLGTNAEGGYSQNFSNWQISAPTHYIQDVPGTAPCRTDNTSLTINCTTGAVTIPTLASTTLTSTTFNGVTIPAKTDTAALLGTAQSFTAGQAVTPSTVTPSGGTYTPNLAASNNLNMTLVHASCPCTLANPTNIVAGQSGVIVVNQSATGSDLISSYGTDYVFTNSATPTLSTAANAVDELSYYVVDSTHIRIAPLISLVKGVTTEGLITSGTKFTTSGCSVSATTGGATSGKYTSGTTGACTVVVTMNGATGLTAPNGWSCWANDETTPADKQQTSNSTTTTATITGTTVSGDVVDFGCVGF